MCKYGSDASACAVKRRLVAVEGGGSGMLRGTLAIALSASALERAAATAAAPEDATSLLLPLRPRLLLWLWLRRGCAAVPSGGDDG